MEAHRKLTLVAVALLALTFLINNNYEAGPGGFNYAYVTGIAMIGAFVLSFVLFTRDRMGTSDL